MKLKSKAKFVGLAAVVMAACFMLQEQLAAQNRTSEPPAPKLDPAAKTKSTIHRWVDQLADDSSTVRATARRQLVEAGVDAVTPLKTAAVSGDPQTAYSSVRLLAEMLHGDDQRVSAAAKLAITDIAEGKSPSARQARKVLEEKAESNVAPAGANLPFGRNRSISRSQINDSERVVVTEDNRRIEILREPNRIVVTIKDADGKESVFKADSEAELKMASKMAWDLVDEYLNQQNGVAIAIGRAGLNGLPFDPFANNRIRLDPFRRRRPGQKDSLAEMARLLKEVKDIAKEGQRNRNSDRLQQIVDKLDHIETHLEILRLERGQ